MHVNLYIATMLCFVPHCHERR